MCCHYCIRRIFLYPRITTLLSTGMKPKFTENAKWKNLCMHQLILHDSKLYALMPKSQQIRQRPSVSSLIPQFQYPCRHRPSLVFAYTAICQRVPTMFGLQLLHISAPHSPPFRYSSPEKQSPFPTKLTNRFWLSLIEKSVFMFMRTAAAHPKTQKHSMTSPLDNVPVYIPTTSVRFLALIWHTPKHIDDDDDGPASVSQRALKYGFTSQCRLQSAMCTLYMAMAAMCNVAIADELSKLVAENYKLVYVAEN